MSTEEQRNIEIKARLNSDIAFLECMKKACTLTKTNGELIKQRDIFYQTQTGRLKLRYQTLSDTKSVELIYYERPNERGPKLSTYRKMNVDQPELLEAILTKSNGQMGILVKERLLFLHDERIRIHLDKVKGFDNFIEFEICLRPNETISDGHAIAEQMMQEFNIKEEHLTSGSYFEELHLNKRYS